MLVVGGVGIDTIVRVPGLPLPPADSIHVEPIREYIAHTGNGVALGCVALGLRTAFVDVIGDDNWGRAIQAHHATAGLETRYDIHPSGTRRSVNLVDPLGRRESLYDGRHPAGYRPPADLWRPYLTRARHVHVSIMEWALAVFDEIEDLGLPSSTDLHDWDGRADYQWNFAVRADAVFTSAAAMPETHAEAARAILERGKARVVIVTDGERGARAFLRDRPGEIHMPATVPNGPIVDSNGAGDSFSSAFLYGWTRGEPVEECLRLGAIAGAFACTVAGTHTAFIDREGLEAARGAATARSAR